MVMYNSPQLGMLLKEMLSCSATGVKYSQKYPKSSKQEKIWESIIKNKLHNCVNKKKLLEFKWFSTALIYGLFGCFKSFTMPFL